MLTQLKFKGRCYSQIKQQLMIQVVEIGGEAPGQVWLEVRAPISRQVWIPVHDQVSWALRAEPL